LTKPVHILGISANYHDSAACLLRDGEIVAAAQEERFSRKKHDPQFPTHAVAFCLQQGGIGPADLDHVAFYDKPLLKFERLLETYLDYAPRGLRSFLQALPLWLSDKLWIREKVASECGFKGRVLFTEHHESHAASAFFPSPFESAAILTIDGVGEWATTSYGFGRGNQVHLTGELHFPHSLGLLYSAFTYYLGYKVNSGEYKVMGLAPYGQPKYVQRILDELIDLRADGSFRLNMQYFDYCHGLTMTSAAFDKLFDGPPRTPESAITQREKDLARSIQEVTEIAMLRMARHVHQQTGEKNLCLAGGVALNCVANGRILREGPFDDLWIQPAAGDAGGALGAALSVWHQYLDQPRGKVCDRMKGALLGPEFSVAEIRDALDAKRAVYDEEGSEHELTWRVARLLADGKVVGWFQGRMEFGPRALGARSILGDPRSPEMQSLMNLKIKFRESFRPFAPSVVEERVPEFFDLDRPSPYMLLTAAVCGPSLPAITHVDGSARVQTVRREDHPLYYDLLAAFGDLTGCPVLINTSFNVRGEPMVCSPEDAYACFMRTGIDYLVIGNFILDKRVQVAPAANRQKEFRLD
jgi:carbamoyltransferase